MITAKKYLEVLEVKHLGGYLLEVSFNDGTHKRVNLTPLLQSPPPVFETLKSEESFSKVTVNPVGGIAWECGADLSAEYLKKAD